MLRTVDLNQLGWAAHEKARTGGPGGLRSPGEAARQGLCSQPHRRRIPSAGSCLGGASHSCTRVPSPETTSPTLEDGRLEARRCRRRGTGQGGSPAGHDGSRCCSAAVRLNGYRPVSAERAREDVMRPSAHEKARTGGWPGGR